MAIFHSYVKLPEGTTNDNKKMWSLYADSSCPEVHEATISQDLSFWNRKMICHPLLHLKQDISSFIHWTTETDARRHRVGCTLVRLLLDFSHHATNLSYLRSPHKWHQMAFLGPLHWPSLPFLESIRRQLRCLETIQSIHPMDHRYFALQWPWLGRTPLLDTWDIWATVGLEPHVSCSSFPSSTDLVASSFRTAVIPKQKLVCSSISQIWTKD